MKIAVITPYHTEPLDMLERAHKTVLTQTHPCTHFMIADGHARTEIDAWQVRHITLPTAHHNNGNTPRAIGSLDAIGDGFDAIAYLDADNWFEPEHIADLVAHRIETSADIVSSGRVIHGIDGGVLLPEGEQEDGTATADTSTMLFSRTAFAVLPLWGTMPNELGPNCDRYIFKGAQALGCKHHHGGQLTMHFTSRYGPHYRAAGLPVPADATAMHAMKDSDQFIRRIGPKGLSHILSGGTVESLFADKAHLPYTVCILKNADALTNDQAQFCDDLENALGDAAEFYYADMDEITRDTTVTTDRNNVFLLWFDGIESERDRLGQIADQNGNLAIIHVRTEDTAESQTPDSTLDRRAWRIITATLSIKDRYAQFCRYGAGHVILSPLQTASDELVACMHSYAR